jgi:hypothetical protein
MAKKSETVGARFQEAIDTYKKLRAFDYVTPLEEFLDKPPSEPERDRVQKSFLRGLKTRFSPESDYSLKLAFKAANLDPQDPLDREALLRCFAAAHFPSRQKTRGAKTKWTPERWSQLLSDYDQVKKDRPKLNDVDICKQIVKRFPSRYPKPPPSARGPAEDPGATVRRNLAPARDPSKNTRLAELAQIFADIMKTEIHKLDPNFDFPIQKLNKRSESLAIEWLSKAWQRERKLAN